MRFRTLLLIPFLAAPADAAILIRNVNVVTMEPGGAVIANGGTLVQAFVDPSACIGVIRTGCEADLLLLAKNPAIDIRNTEAIVGIMADGRWSTPESLNAARH